MTGDGAREQRQASTLALEGEVDLSNVAAYRGRIERAVRDAPDGLVVDLSDVRFIDTAGIAMLFHQAARLSDERTQIAYVASEKSLIRRILTIADLPLHRSRREAQRALSSWLRVRRGSSGWT